MQKRAHQSFVAMRSVIAVRDFVNRYARFSRPLRSGILFFMRVLEKHLRTPLFIDAPEVVELPPQIVRRADAIAPLREKGVFQQLFKVKQLPDEPQLIRYVVRSVNGETSEMGADFEDEALAYIRALGEGVERFVWKNFPYAHMSVQSTQQYLTDAHIDVTQVAGFSDELRAQHTKLQINEADSFRWVRGTIADSREPIWIPLQFMQCQHDEKQIRPTITTGLSAHESYKRARNAGLMEIIERDAFMLSYVNQHTPERINNQAVTLPKLRRALQEHEAYDLDIALVMLPTDFPVHTVAAVITDTRGGPYVSVGMGVDTSLECAALGALTEAAAIRQGTRLCVPHPEKHADEYKEYYKTHAHNALRVRSYDWAFRKQRLDDIQFFISGAKRNPATFPDFPSSEDDVYQGIVARCDELGYRIATFDMTQTEYRECGWHVVFSFIPDMQPLPINDRYPCAGGVRLRTIPHELGFTPATESYTGSVPFA